MALLSLCKVQLTVGNGVRVTPDPPRKAFLQRKELVLLLKRRPPELLLPTRRWRRRPACVAGERTAGPAASGAPFPPACQQAGWETGQSATAC